jgi:uncharacterized protein (TIGR03118 family)
MRTTVLVSRFRTVPFGLAAWFLMSFLSGCTRDINGPGDEHTPSADQAQSLEKHRATSLMEVDLVADVPSLAPVRIDASLQNAWGIAITPNGRIWISSNHAGLSVIYDEDGNTVRAPVSIPTKDDSVGGAPTGVIFNSTQGFIIPQTGEDGIISAWASGSNARVVADRSASDAVYKGLALARDGSADFIYAADFKGGRIDVFDDHFQLVTTKPFLDPSIPAGFAPFNVQNIDGKLFVTYAMQKGPENEDDQAGAGNGYIDVYRTDGSLVRRFASRGMLNSPWGLAKMPEHSGEHTHHKILVGNFGDGRINIFSEHGKFIGQASDEQGSPIAIFGLWALAFIGGDATPGHDGHGKDKALPRLFFTAGPNDEANGLFGYLQFQRRHMKPPHDDDHETTSSD